MAGSYIFRGVELNDGVNFFVDARNTAFDDPNAASASYGTRKHNTPVQIGADIKEVTLPLILNLIADTPAKLEARMNRVRQLFQPGPEIYTFRRRLPHQTYHRYLRVGVRDVTFNTLERKAIITLQSESNAWMDETENSQTETFFEDELTGKMFVNYTGNLPVEPIIELKLKTPSTAGDTPLYYREVEVFATEKIAGYPIKIVDGWDVTSEVSAGKIRADYSDISVRMADGTVCDHYIHVDAPNILTIWARPPKWPVTHASIPYVRAPMDDYQMVPDAVWSPGDPIDQNWYFRVEPDQLPPSEGILKVGDEYIRYDMGEYYETHPFKFYVRILERGVYGTVPDFHYMYDIITFPTTLRICYGYSPTSNVRFNLKEGDGWPEIDYKLSSTSVWWYLTGYTKQITDPNSGESTGLNWYYSRQYSPVPRQKEYIVAHPDPKLGGLVATYPSNTTSTTRLTLLHPGAGGQRRMSAMEIWFKRPDGAVGDIQLRRVRSSFGTDREFSEEIVTFSNPSSDFSSGYIDLNSVSRPATHFTIGAANVPLGTSSKSVVKIEKWALYWDGVGSGARSMAPVVRGLGDEKGLTSGEYPLIITLHNATDIQTNYNFNVSAQVPLDTAGVIDCAEHTVTGAIQFREVQYKRATWLRLLPGMNQINVHARAGTGEIEVKLRWRNRY